MTITPIPDPNSSEANVESILEGERSRYSSLSLSWLSCGPDTTLEEVGVWLRLFEDSSNIHIDRLRFVETW